MVNSEVICSIVDSYLESRKGDMRRQLHATVDEMLEELMRGVGRQVQQLLIAFQPSESLLSSTMPDNLEAYPLLDSMANFVYAVKSSGQPSTTTNNNAAATVVSAIHNGKPLGSVSDSNDVLNVNNLVNGNCSAAAEKTGSSGKIKFFKNYHAAPKKVVSPSKRGGGGKGDTITVKVCYNDSSVKAKKFSAVKRRSRDTLEKGEDEEENIVSPPAMRGTAKRRKSDHTDATGPCGRSEIAKIDTTQSSTPLSNNRTQKSVATKRSGSSTTPKRIWACPENGCGKVLNRQGEFVTHMRRHLSISPYYCTWPGCTFRGYEKFASLRHVKQTHYRRTTKDGTPEQINQWDPNLYIEVDETLLKAELPSPKGEGAKVASEEKE